jgi:hypothetical protein
MVETGFEWTLECTDRTRKVMRAGKMEKGEGQHKGEPFRDPRPGGGRECFRTGSSGKITLSVTWRLLEGS